MRQFDLVITDEGYYGIITDVPRRWVYLSNGCEQIQSEEQFSKNRVQPLNIFNDAGAPANFVGYYEMLEQRHDLDKPMPVSETSLHPSDGVG